MLDDRPIDAAPRDGTEIMLWCDDGVWRKARWMRDDIWVTSDGELHIRGTCDRDYDFITASIWAPVTTPDDGAAHAAVTVATVSHSPVASK